MARSVCAVNLVQLFAAVTITLLTPVQSLDNNGKLAGKMVVYIIYSMIVYASLATSYSVGSLCQ